MTLLRITADELDGLESAGFRFGWRARSITTGELLRDDELRALEQCRLRSGSKRTWNMEHFVIWPKLQPEDSRGEAVRELEALYESDERVRQAFETADGQRSAEMRGRPSQSLHDGTGLRKQAQSGKHKGRCHGLQQ